jgi:hypothetical protein
MPVIEYYPHMLPVFLNAVRVKTEYFNIIIVVTMIK